MTHKLSALLLFLPFVVFGASVFAPTPNSVRFQDQQLYVDNKPFYIKGLCYSPVPVGESPQFPPFGDYFTAEYAYIWKRDLPLIKEMGVNTIRIYGWDTTHEITHFEFLDEVHRHGLKILLTFYVGTKYENPPVYINTPALKQVPITNFTREAAIYGDHPAILFWSFGNELNGPWNGFFDQINEIYSCGWQAYGSCWNADSLAPACMVANECLYKNFFGWINDASVQVRASTTRPVISGMADVDRITDKNSKMNVSKLQLYGQYAPDLAAWSFQLYRGAQFGNYFKYYRKNLLEHPKPLIITEYGTDAYNDPCGWPQNNAITTCRNLVGDPGGGVARSANGSFEGCKDLNLDCVKPGEEVQAEWDVALTQEIYSHRVGTGGGPTSPTPVPTCTGPWEGYPDCGPKMQWLSENWQKDPSYAEAGIDGSPCSIQKFLNDEGLYCPDPFSTGGSGEGVTIGGFMMAWMDEFWKGNIITEGHCTYPCNPTNLSACYEHTKDFEVGRAAGCTWKAHWDCPNKNPYYHGLCGYKLEGAPDFYVNEEWFGLTMPERCGKFISTGFAFGEGNPQKYGLDTVNVRGTMKAMQKIWAPENWAKSVPFNPLGCDALLPCWQCIQDHPTEKAAFLTSCASACDISPIAPTPVPAPSSLPSLVPTAAPTSGAPSAPLSSAPTPVWSKTEVTLKFKNISLADHVDLIVELSAFFNVLPSRFEVLKQRNTASGVFVDMIFADGAPVTFENLFELLVSELEFIKLDPDRGCTLPPKDCKEYLGHFQGKILDQIDPQYPPTIDGNVETPTPAAAPSAAAPTPASSPTKAPLTPTAQSPTAVAETKRLQLKLTSRSLKLPADVKEKFEMQLATFFGIDKARVQYVRTHDLKATPPTVMVDFLLVEGTPSIATLYQQLTRELLLMKNSSVYGCGGKACSEYTSPLAKGDVLQYLNAYYTPELDGAFMIDAPPPEPESSSTTGLVVAGCVIGALLLVAALIFWRRHQKAKKFTANQLLSYQDVDTDSEPAYVAQKNTLQ